MSTTSRQALPTTSGGLDYADRFARLIAASFAEDPLNRYFIRSKDSLPNSAAISQERLLEHFHSSSIDKVKSGAIIVETGDWAGAALWYVFQLHLIC